MTGYVPLASLYDPKVPVPLLGVLGYSVRGAGGTQAAQDIEASSGSPPASVMHGDLMMMLLCGWIALVAVRCQYYGAWLLAEGAGVLQGYGFVQADAKVAVIAADPAGAAPHEAPGAGVGPVSGRPGSVIEAGSPATTSGSSASSASKAGQRPGDAVGKPIGSGSGSVKGTWTGISNIDVLQCEFAPSLSTIIRHWNTQVQGWLLKDVYGRFPKGSESMAKFATLGVSALWHGFYSGYYVGFFQVSLAQQAQAGAYEICKPLLVGASNEGTTGPAFLSYLGSFVGLSTYVPPKLSPGRPHLPMWAMPIACFMASTALNYSMAPFPLLHLERGLGFYTAARYFLHPVLIALAVGGPLVEYVRKALGVGRSSSST